MQWDFAGLSGERVVSGGFFRDFAGSSGRGWYRERFSGFWRFLGRIVEGRAEGVVSRAGLRGIKRDEAGFCGIKRGGGSVGGGF